MRLKLGPPVCTGGMTAAYRQTHAANADVSATAPPFAMLRLRGTGFKHSSSLRLAQLGKQPPIVDLDCIEPRQSAGARRGSRRWLSTTGAIRRCSLRSGDRTSTAHQAACGLQLRKESRTAAESQPAAGRDRRASFHRRRCATARRQLEGLDTGIRCRVSAWDKALEHGIEPDYVHTVIRTLKVPAAEGAGESWPWPVRIYTLGRFEIFIDDAKVEYSRKLPKRPPALLKFLLSACAEAEERRAGDLPAAAAHAGRGTRSAAGGCLRATLSGCAPALIRSCISRSLAQWFLQQPRINRKLVCLVTTEVRVDPQPRPCWRFQRNRQVVARSVQCQ